MQLRMGGRLIGFDSEGEGVPLLLMHAFPLSRAMFRSQVEALRSRVRVLAFDVPGVGESEPGPVSMEDIADLAARFLDAQEIEKAIVGGVSMGGYASFAFVRRHADRLRGLVLANTRAAADTEEARAGRSEMAAVARQQGAAEIARRLLPKLLGDTSRRERPELVEHVRSMVEATDPEAIANLLEALGARADSGQLLGQIAVPTLVIAGEEDPLAPPQEAAEWAAKIPGARFVVLQRAGHLANLEVLDSFTDELGRFVDHVGKIR